MLRAGHRLHREEQHVGEEEQAERRREGHAPPVPVGERQRARARQQHAEAAQQPAVDGAQRVEDLVEPPLQREVFRVEPAFAAGRAEGGRDRASAVRAGPGCPAAVRGAFRPPQLSGGGGRGASGFAEPGIRDLRVARPECFSRSRTRVVAFVGSTSVRLRSLPGRSTHGPAPGHGGGPGRSAPGAGLLCDCLRPGARGAICSSHGRPGQPGADHARLRRLPSW